VAGASPNVVKLTQKIGARMIERSAGVLPLEPEG
jgi:hypothetical protein